MSPVLPACNLNEVDDGLKHLFIHFLSSQERISHLEEDLCDERGSADRLMERLDKTKEQAGLLPCCLCCFFCVCFFFQMKLTFCIFLMLINFPPQKQQPTSDRFIACLNFGPSALF